MKLTVEKLMKEYGYERAQAEQEVKRANCKHDYGTMCTADFQGCHRTCQKCGQMLGIPGGCTPRKSTLSDSKEP